MPPPYMYPTSGGDKAMAAGYPPQTGYPPASYPPQPYPPQGQSYPPQPYPAQPMAQQTTSASLSQLSMFIYNAMCHTQKAIFKKVTIISGLVN